MFQVLTYSKYSTTWIVNYYYIIYYIITKSYYYCALFIQRWQSVSLGPPGLSPHRSVPKSWRNNLRALWVAPPDLEFGEWHWGKKQLLSFFILISQLIKGSKEKFFIKPNFRRKYQTSSSGQKFFSKKCIFPCCLLSIELSTWFQGF